MEAVTKPLKGMESSLKHIGELTRPLRGMSSSFLGSAKPERLMSSPNGKGALPSNATRAADAKSGKRDNDKPKK